MFGKAIRLAFRSFPTLQLIHVIMLSMDMMYNPNSKREKLQMDPILNPIDAS